FGQYEKAEWRMPLRIVGCTNVKVYGLTLRDSGGDGIIVGRGGERAYCEDIHIKEVVCDNNYRQGISVISVDGLLVEDCVFRNTWGTPPSSGVDIEPDSADERIRDVVFRNCSFEDNYGDGIEVFLANLTADSGDVSIRFDNCRVTSKWGAGIRVTKIGDAGPGGLIEFVDCVVDSTEGYGIKVQDKSADRARVRFVNCAVRNAANNRGYAGAWAPVWLHLPGPKFAARFGGIDFVDCVVEDDHDRPAITFEETESDFGIADITGTITVANPHGVKHDLGRKQQGVTLVVKGSD
ncbi:MAG: right-handed parallel beta-helix repeat-containing protein, partial [Armatimonadota bacterium]